MKTYKNLRIIEAGATSNTIDKDGKTYTISVSPSALDSLCALGNEKAIHSRRSHNGNDLLDEYIGSFTNFRNDGKAVFADLTLSESVKKAYPSFYTFMESMIETEPDMLGVSVAMDDIKEYNDEALTAEIVEVTDLYTCDLVGLPAATSSLFNQNSNKMGLFSTIFSRFAKDKLSTETYTTSEGVEITIVAAGEEAQIGDAVNDSEGNPVADGDYRITTPEGDLIVVVAGGVIADMKEAEEEPDAEELADDAEEDKDEKKTPTPEEFSKLSKTLASVQKELATVKTQLNKRTGAPTNLGRRTPETKGNGETALSKEAVQKKAAEFRKVQMKRY